jgi:signal peptidase I
MRTVREIARDLGVSHEEVLRRLRALGRPAAGASSLVDPVVAARLRGGGAGPSSDDGHGVRARVPPPPPPPRTPPPPPTAERPPVEHSPTGAGVVAPPRRDAAPAEGAAPGDPWAQERALGPRARRPWAPGDGEPPPTRAASRWGAQLAELPVLILLAFGIAVLIKTFLVQAFFIPSGSMLPTLRVGDRVLVEKISYRLRDPRGQDVVVFAKSVFGRAPDLPWYQDARNFMRELLGLPTGTEQDYIKRIVAVGGDTVRYAGKPRRLTVNGAVVEETYLKGGVDRFSPSLTAPDCARLDMRAARGGCVVPEGKVFVMGDNRGNSEDSRAIGPIDEGKVVGRAFVIIWPLGDVSGI